MPNFSDPQNEAIRLDQGFSKASKPAETDNGKVLNQFLKTAWPRGAGPLQGDSKPRVAPSLSPAELSSSRILALCPNRNDYPADLERSLEDFYSRPHII